MRSSPHSRLVLVLVLVGCVSFNNAVGSTSGILNGPVSYYRTACAVAARYTWRAIENNAKARYSV